MLSALKAVQLCLHTYWFPSLQDYQLPQTRFNLLFPLTHANKLCLLSDSPDPCKARLLWNCSVSLHCFVLYKSLLREFAEAHTYHSKPRFPSKVCTGSFCSAYLDWFASTLYCVGSDLQSHEASPSCSWLEIGCWKLLGSLWPPETRQTAPAHLQIEKTQQLHWRLITFMS